jgi:hypothetical protein
MMGAPLSIVTSGKYMVGARENQLEDPPVWRFYKYAQVEEQ